MRQISRVMTLALASIALAASVASSAPESLALDPAHTNVGFTVRHFFSKVPGRFTDFAGTVQFDSKSIAASSVDVTIQATSVNTANERRDNHLRSGDFFEVEKFPTLTFKSSKITADGDKTALAPGDKFKIAGDLTIKGITKPVTLDATFLGSGSMPMGPGPAVTIAGFEATTTVNRKDFNILWNRTLDQGGTMLGDDVTINIAVEAKTPMPARPADAKPADAKPATDKK